MSNLLNNDNNSVLFKKVKITLRNKHFLDERQQEIEKFTLDNKILKEHKSLLES